MTLDLFSLRTGSFWPSLADTCLCLSPFNKSKDLVLFMWMVYTSVYYYIIRIHFIHPIRMYLIIYSGEPHLEQFLIIFTKPTFCKRVFLTTVQLCFLHLNIYRTLNFVSSLETCLSYPNVFHTKFIVQEQFCVYKSSKILKIKFSSILGIEKTSITRERDRQSGNREHHDDQRRKVPLNFLFQKVR